MLAPAVVTAAPVAAVPAAAAASVPAVVFVQGAAARPGGIAVSWAPAATTDAVTGYRVAAAPVTTTAGCPAVTVAAPATDSAAVVGGLCEAVAYAATVAATNATGTGPASARSAAAVPGPLTAPDAPQVTGVYARPGGLAVAWVPPTGDGGTPVTAYTVVAKQGATSVTATAAASARTATLTGLANGTAASVQVTAVNARGASAAATGVGTPAAAPKPTVPRDLTVTPATGGAVTAAWTEPEDTGGLSVTRYTVTYRQVVQDTTGDAWVPAPGTSPITATTTGTTVTIPAITPATALYSFSVTATTTAGTGPAVATAAPVSPTTSVGANTVTFTAATMAALTAADPSSLTWTAPAPAQVTALTAGKILVGAPAAAAPEGLLRKVVGVEQSSGTYRVLTVPAALTDAFDAFTLSKTMNPLTTPGASPGSARFRPSVPGVRAAPSVNWSGRITLELGRGLDERSSWYLSGAATLEPKITVGLSLLKGFLNVPTGVRVTTTAEISTELRMSFGVASVAESKRSPKKKIGEVKAPPIPLVSGPVVIVLVPQVDVYVSVTGKVGFTVRDSFTIGATAEWRSTNSGSMRVTDVSARHAPLGSPRPGFTYDASAAVAIIPEPSVKVYDLLGPYFALQLSLEAALQSRPAAGEPYFTLTPRVSIMAGLELEVLGKRADVKVTLAKAEWPRLELFTNPGPYLDIQPADAEVLPGATLQFTARRSDGGAARPITWSLDGAAGDTVSGTGLLTTKAPGNRRLTVRAKDDTGAQGQVIVTVGAGVDPPGNLTAAPHPQESGATVTWTAPVNTGGSPIASYTIVTDPPTGPRTVAAGTTTVDLPGLAPGGSYLISAYATNTAGVTSPAATTQLRVPLRPPGCPIDLTLGRTGTCTLIRAGQVDNFTIAATAGDRLRLHVAPSSGGTSRPALTTGVLSPGGAVTCPAKADDDLDCPIPATGTYTVVVRDFYGTGIGGYTITPQRLTNPVGCGTLTVPATTAGTVTLGGNPCHRIAATAGERIRLHTVPTAKGTGLAIWTDLIAPAGTVACGGKTAGDLDCAITATGTYTAIVRDYYGQNTGPYAITPQRLTNPAGCTTLAIGAGVFGTLTLGGVRCYRVASTAGRVLQMSTSTAPGVLLAPQADVVSPTGAIVCTPRVGARTCTTPAAGTYTITVSDFYGYQTGTFTLAVT